MTLVFQTGRPGISRRKSSVVRRLNHNKQAHPNCCPLHLRQNCEWSKTTRIYSCSYWWTWCFRLSWCLNFYCFCNLQPSSIWLQWRRLWCFHNVPHPSNHLFLRGVAYLPPSLCDLTLHWRSGHGYWLGGHILRRITILQTTGGGGYGGVQWGMQNFFQ